MLASALGDIAASALGVRATMGFTLRLETIPGDRCTNGGCELLDPDTTRCCCCEKESIVVNARINMLVWDYL